MLDQVYSWIVFAHIAGALGFVMAHGVSFTVAFRIRHETDLERIRVLLELSASSISYVYGGLLILLVAGVVAGIAHGWFGYLWPWLSIVTLVVLAVVMYVRGTAYYNQLRHAVGMRTYQDPPDARPPEPVAPEVLARLLRSHRPEELAVVGGVGLAVLLWLMVVKPA
jgi:hypothetical protein